jgi:hypothetical protein
MRPETGESTSSAIIPPSAGSILVLPYARICPPALRLMAAHDHANSHFPEVNHAALRKKSTLIQNYATAAAVARFNARPAQDGCR